MDLWSRLIGGSGSSPTKPRQSNTPAERLAAFKRSSNALQQIWRTSTPLPSKEGATSHCAGCLQRLNQLLDDESKTTPPFSCLNYAASSQIYIIITKLALSSGDAGVIKAAARLFHTLINSEVDGVLDSKIFARALIDLARRNIGSKVIALGEEDEGDLVELLFSIATKIKLDPAILSAWFYPSPDLGVERDGTKSEFAGATRRVDFPLFYLLVDYVYHDGRTGDFARTGLLYLTDTASKSRSLERWMIESDLATLMASGLGALYSRLSRRLPSFADRAFLPPVLALSDLMVEVELSSMSKTTFRHDLDAFLSYLLFWQDTLNHCQSVEVNDTLLDHFQVLFLEQLLYPSLLESSDANGGSTASVMMYLHQILDVLNRPELVQRILGYLLASKSEVLARTRARTRKQRMSLSRRKSFDALTVLAQANDHPSPDLFNLVDLIMMGLKSNTSQTVAASLRLVSVMQQRHHIYTRRLLIHTEPVEEPLLRPLTELNERLQSLMALAPIVSDDGSIDESYGEIIKDVTESLTSHSCAITAPHDGDDLEASYALVSPDDPVVAELITLLALFFTNDTVTNLALTEAILSTASCPLIDLDGWLLPSASTPSIVSVLENLTDQIRQWRGQTPVWDDLINLQRSRLNPPSGADIDIASRSAPSRQSTESSRPASNRPSIDVPRTPTRPARRRPRNLASDGLHSGFGSLSSSPNPPLSAFHPARIGSPLRRSHVADSSQQSSVSQGSASLDELETLDLLGMTIKVEVPGGNDGGQEGEGEDEEGGSQGSVSLSHALVNAILLQEFVLEVAAVVQVRACLWGEVRLD